MRHRHLCNGKATAASLVSYDTAIAVSAGALKGGFTRDRAELKASDAVLAERLTALTAR